MIAKNYLFLLFSIEAFFLLVWGRNEKEDVPPLVECNYYMAESTIPNSGFGMFTATEILHREDILYPEIVLQVADYQHHIDLRKEVVGNEEDDYYWLPKEYYWDGRNTRGIYESFFNTESLIPGLGMLANSHTGLVNAVISGPPKVSSGKNGSYSAFHGFRHFATEDIAVGSELFVEYGDDWFAGREWKFGPIPLSHDFQNADDLLDKFHNLLFLSETSSPNTKKRKKEDLWQFIRDKLSTKERMKMALPEDWQILEKGKNSAQMSVPHHATRSIEWLQSNGYCIDHIRPGTSTIPNAGRGAFATRFLPKDTIIAPAPLVQMHRHHNEMYFKQDYGDNIDMVGTQLLQNYCFGHAKSSLLLFPYAPIVNLINHSPSSPNARIQWSSSSSSDTGSIINSHEWFEKSTDEILKQDHPVLMLEFVATRDIQEGEEIFIDYGDNWQNAWEQHSQTWDTTISSSYVDAHTLRPRFIQTYQEQMESTSSNKDHLPDNFMTICYFPQYKWVEFLRDENMEQTPEEMEWESGDENDANWMRFMSHSKPCEIFERMENSHTYHARFVLKNDDGMQKHFFILRNIPRHAIEFVNKPYSSDQYFKGAFRHEIEIPEDIFPTAWMDLLLSSSSTEQETEEPDSTTENNLSGVNDWTTIPTNEERSFICWIPNDLLEFDDDEANSDADPNDKEITWLDDGSDQQQIPCTILSKEIEDPELSHSIIPPFMSYTVEVMISSESIIFKGVPHDAIEYETTTQDED